MKLLLTILIPITAIFFSCSDDTPCIVEKYGEAIYLSKSQLRSIQLTEPREIERPGGLYYKDGYLYVLELGDVNNWYEEEVSENQKEVIYHPQIDKTGLHIIDNRIPQNPQNVGFITIPGVNGMAAKGNQLYADSFHDLMVFDITHPSSPELMDSVLDVYDNIPYYLDDSLGLQIGHTVIYEQSDVDCPWGGESSFWYYTDDLAAAESLDAGTGSTGVAGSMARFITVDDYLYSIDYSILHLFDVSGERPSKLADIDIGWGIETIYPYEDKLFFGAIDGMYIYDNSNPTAPRFLSKYLHVTSCDPVIVTDDIAYVTLRNGGECQGFANQLEIIDVSNPYRPNLLKTYPMENPHGLSLINHCLFICEGEFGLKTFDVSPIDPTAITLNNTVDIHAFDVISLPDITMVVGNDGFYQYSSMCSEPTYLSTISF
ncbi:MAG: hypothetical protein AAF620_13200 [Bacteroidota bacterium]